MKETGIIMSGNHPTLILNGIKTMTRRTWGLEKINDSPDEWQLVAIFQDGLARFYNIYNIKTEQDITIKCPYGGYGDRLWVRESFYSESGDIWYKADGQTAPMPIKWKPSIHMHRWASRITREITEVRVERLQEITGQDIKSEGIKVPFEGTIYHQNERLQQFIDLWDSLNAKRGYPWKGNWWVWAISWPKYSPKNVR